MRPRCGSPSPHKVGGSCPHHHLPRLPPPTAASVCSASVSARSPPRSSPASSSPSAATRSPVGSLTQIGDDPARQAHRRRVAADPRLRAARVARRDRLRRVGPLSPTTPTPPRAGRGCSTRAATSRRSATRCASIRPMPAAFDPYYVKRLEGTNVKDGDRQAGDARRDPRRHRHASGREPARPARDDLVRVDRDLHRARPDARRPRRVRGGDRRGRPDDRAVDALRVRRAAGGRPVRQRRAQPRGRHAGAASTTRSSRASRSAARTSRPARRCSRPCSRRC